MRALLFTALSVLALTLSLSADDKGEKIDAKKLVGKWTPKEKKDGAFVLEFMKDGKAAFIDTKDGKEVRFEGTYKIDGNKLTVTVTVDGKDVPQTQTVSKLTDDELTSTSQSGKEDTLVRVKDKK